MLESFFFCEVNTSLRDVVHFALFKFGVKSVRNQTEPCPSNFASFIHERYIEQLPFIPLVGPSLNPRLLSDFELCFDCPIVRITEGSVAKERWRSGPMRMVQEWGWERQRQQFRINLLASGITNSFHEYCQGHEERG